jgi:hypothetical protein
VNGDERKVSPSSRWNELVDDLFKTGGGTEDAAAEWPHPDYAAAAKACGPDRASLEKLRRLCEDLESIISLDPGPGTLIRVAGVPLDELRPLAGRCWREILLDENLGRAAWMGLRSYSEALKGPAMDSGTRRTGAVIHAVCVARLEASGEVANDERERGYDLAERKAIQKKLYMPASLARVLGA